MTVPSQEEARLDLPAAPDALRQLRTGQRMLLTGTVYTARDAAHARFAEAIAARRALPFDPQGQALYFVGPTPAPPGRVIGSAGPTTASRMDPFSPLLVMRGLSVMIGKGRRSATVRASMLEHGCVYLGAVEGTAALLSDCVRSMEVVAYPDLGPEAVHRLTIADFPAVVVNDLHGGDQYEAGPREYRVERIDRVDGNRQNS